MRPSPRLGLGEEVGAGAGFGLGSRLGCAADVLGLGLGCVAARGPRPWSSAAPHLSLCTSLYLPISPYISLYLALGARRRPISLSVPLCISLYLPISRPWCSAAPHLSLCTSLYLPTSPYISLYLPIARPWCSAASSGSCSRAAASAAPREMWRDVGRRQGNLGSSRLAVEPQRGQHLVRCRVRLGYG